MRRFAVLVPLVSVGLLASGLAAAGAATAGTTQGAGGHHGVVHVINLGKAFQARLGHAAHTAESGPAGITYPKGMAPIGGRGGNDCPEPYCPVTYHGGPVQLTPHVYLLLWGPNWSSDPNQAATASYLESFYSGLGNPPGEPADDNWSTVASQYGDASGNPSFNDTVYQGVWQDMNTPPSDTSQTELAAEADTFASTQGITDLADAQIVVATQEGTCPAGFYAPSVCGSNGGYYCAWHNYSKEAYINLPYLLDAGTSCGQDAVNADGTYDGFSMVGGHEFGGKIRLMKRIKVIKRFKK